MCVICNHEHKSTKFVTVQKANKKEFRIFVCAYCALMLAGHGGYHP